MAVRQIGSRVGSWKFKPWQPAPLPANSYDPSIDAQVGQANRGYADTQAATSLANQRALTDYGLQTQGIKRSLSQGQADLGTAKSRGIEDYNRNIMLLNRSYALLANRQKQQANAAGVLNGGALLQAAAKRQQNMLLERQPQDQQYQRFLADNALQGGRLQENADLQLGSAGLGLQRGQEDRTTALTTAGRENSFFGLDAARQKNFQAAQNGVEFPQPGKKGGQPLDQYVTTGGRTLRKVVRDGIEYHVDSNGKIVSFKHFKPEPPKKPDKKKGK